jgi:D-alanyl-lipoteichoic acid acyltransferase DltB (MBOAT superfamily)
MSFLSIEFWTVFPVFFWIYWLFAARPVIQNTLLLLASYGLLACFDHRFALFLAWYSSLTYLLSLLIHKNPGGKIFFVLSIAFSLSWLAVFKYHDFFRDVLQELLAETGLAIPGLELIVPLGISFYTFHSISYLVSVWRREIVPASFLDYALFLAFFPCLISGPINRAKDFLPRIQTIGPREIGDPCRAFVLLMLALIKVLWMGSTLLENQVRPVFDNPLEYHALNVLLAAYAYAVYIYLNFSGYTDLVTAIALFLGFSLPVNFDAPYLAWNLQDFWRRWHISLSFFMRDYVYIPLGGSRGGWASSLRNLVFTLLVSGLWHGASYNFLVWGAIHGVGMALHRLTGQFYGKPLIENRRLATVLTFHFVCFAWIFFRGPSLSDALRFLGALGNFDTSLHFDALFWLCLFALAFVAYPRMSRLPEHAAERLRKMHWSLRPLVLTPLAWTIIMFSPSGVPEFIYAAF